MVGRIQEMVEQESRARSAAAAERLGLPPSIQLPDGEYGQDAHLQLRAPYQVPTTCNTLTCTQTLSRLLISNNSCNNSFIVSFAARRADEKQRSASTKQMRERRPGVGGRGGRAADTARRGRRQRGQEGRAATKGHAVDGAHGRAAAAAVLAGQRAAALRHGAAARRAQPAARRVTPPRRTTPLPYHAYIPLSGRSDSPECTRVPEYYRLGIYLFGTGRGPGRLRRGAGLAPRGAHPVICAKGRVVTVRTLRTLRATRRTSRQ